MVQLFQIPSDYAGIINPRCSLEPSHSDGIESLCLSGSRLYSGGRDMSIMCWDLTDTPQLRQVPCHHLHCRHFQLGSQEELERLCAGNMKNFGVTCREGTNSD